MEFQPGTKTASGYFALPESGTGPGVLVLHAWWGLNDFFVELCDRLAREGYVVLAPDLYAGVVVSTIGDAENAVQHAEGGEEKALAALDFLKQHPAVQGHKIGSLGISFGAWWAVQLASLRPEEITATVIFYGVAEADFSAARSAYLGHFAQNDSFEPLEQVAAMEAGLRASGKEVEFYIYPDTGHWFFESDRPDAYEPASAQLAWDRTVDFLKTHLS